MPLDLFSPLGTATTAVSASNVTASGALNLSTGAQTYSVRVYNACTVDAFIKFGTSAVTATTSDMPIPTLGVETFEISPAITHAAVILGSSTGTVYFTPGRGA